MGTRRRVAERKPVALAIETLEDRFLLSGAASLSVPAPMHEPTAILAAAPNSTATNAARSASPQESPSYASAQPAPASVVSQPLSAASAKGAGGINYIPLFFPTAINPPGYQRDADGDQEVLIRVDADAYRNVASAAPLSFVDNDAAGGQNFALPYRALEEITARTASPLPFLPLLSASGLGILGTASSPWIPPAAAISGNASGNHDPPVREDGGSPMPETPQALPATPLPRLEKSAASPPHLPPRVPLADRVPIDLEAIQRGVDAFLQQLSQLSEQWSDSRLLEKIVPCLLATSVAGYGWFRFRNRRERRLADLSGQDGLITAPTIFLPGEEG
ncbi:MAG: LEPR-XLL domain-containing protein [Gemmataceae bacterium]